MSTEQQTLGREPLPYTNPKGYNFDRERFAADLRAHGINPDYLERQPLDVLDEVDDDDQFWRFQSMQQLWYATGPKDDRDYCPIQFRVVLYTVNEPTTTLKRHLQEVVQERLHSLFNTGKYDGYIAGFQCDQADALDIENQEVGATEADHLGIGQWFVEVYQEDGETVRGEASGFFDPWAITRRSEAPQHEVWRLSRRDDRGTYEIQPRDAARQRLKNLDQSKNVIVNGRPVGGVNRSRGYIEINQRYSDHVSNDGGGTKYDGDHSRYGLIQAGMHPNEMQNGGKIYKVRETADTIVLVTSKSRVRDYEQASGNVWDPAPEGEVDAAATGEEMLTLADEAPTLFDIRKDQDNPGNGAALGRYSPPTTREITERTPASALVTI